MDRRRFILDNTQLASPPACPEILLHMATEVSKLWQATEDFLDLVNCPPPYWAFAWVGGQALTRYVLDNPAVVAGKRVLDFAAGSGMTAIAAAKAGAASAEAAEIDVVAADAIHLNADANKVEVPVLLEDLLANPESRWDVVLAGDVCYERPMAEAVFTWMRELARQGTAIYMADPGRAYLPKTGLMKVASYSVACSRDLEDRDTREATIYKIVG